MKCHQTIPTICYCILNQPIIFNQRTNNTNLDFDIVCSIHQRFMHLKNIEIPDMLKKSKYNFEKVSLAQAEGLAK